MTAWIEARTMELISVLTVALLWIAIQQLQALHKTLIEILGAIRFSIKQSDDVRDAIRGQRPMP
jgi:hypothetical protein